MNWFSIMDTIVKYLQGFLTPLIAIIALYIAYQQHKTNRDKLRVELYDRRLGIYITTERFLTCICKAGDVPDDLFEEFEVKAGEARFIYKDKKITYFLDAIRDKTIKARQLQRTIDTVFSAKWSENELKANKEKAIKESRGVHAWFREAKRKSFTQVFEKYLSFE